MCKIVDAIRGCLLLLCCGVLLGGCGPSGSPERTVECAMQAMARLDAVGMAHYLCAEQAAGAEELRRSMASARAQGARMELAEMRYELLERDGDAARVRMTGLLRADHPTQGPSEERLDEIVRCRVEGGRWKVCGGLM